MQVYDFSILADKGNVIIFGESFDKKIKKDVDI